MSSGHEKSLGRRGLLKVVGSASGVAAIASVMPATISPAEAYDPGRRETRARYRPDAPDVQAFYRTNGYETLKK